MAGPTPVSALIHAATMVTAGVYMVARSHALFILTPITLNIIAIIGITTALFAASIAIYQNDIKKVLAYSTISQLGYMFVGLGVGAFTGAMFHLTTHAFFKALLFLAAGSVIHSLNGEQDIRKMGGLRKFLPVTWIVFLAGTLAISGIPPFSGFFSKDEILLGAWEHNKLIWALGVICSMMTTFYMFRLLFLTFSGSFRGSDKQKSHLHESRGNMTVPLILLAILSLCGGLLNIPEIFGGEMSLHSFLSPIFNSSALGSVTNSAPAPYIELLLMTLTVVGALIFIYFAWLKFIKRNIIPIEDNAGRSLIPKMLYRKYYIDELYTTLIERPVLYLSVIFHKVDVNIIDKAVDSFGYSTIWLGIKVRKIQTGTIGFYLVAMVLSIVALLIFGLLI
jgi:NADH-quinone oxidoreductase subunit L